MNSAKTKQTDLKNKSVIILGAGLAGLTAAYELVKAKYQVTVIERWNDVGGLARTIEYKGFSFDTGPHRWYTKNDMVNTWMLKLLGKEVTQVPRLTRIYFDGTFFNYPIKIKSTLKGMGVLKTLRAIIDYIYIRTQQLIFKKEPINLEEGYISKFGKTLYEMFFKRYSEKLWGTSCKNISADWIGQRTRGFNVATVIKDALFRNKNVVSFIDEFSYPDKGIGRIAQKMAGGIKKGGGKILLNHEVIRLKYEGNRITQVVMSTKQERKSLTPQEVINTIAISDLVAYLEPQAPFEVVEINRKFTYRDEIQVTLFVNKSHLTPDTWIYVHSFDLPFIRFMETDNWSKKMSPSGKTSLVFELACNEDDILWRKKDQELVDIVTQAFIKEYKLINNEDVLGSYVHRVPKEYPVYHIGYKEDLKILRKYLDKFTNLQTVGRNGLFRYNNMDHSIEMGMYAAWNVIEGERKFDVDAVNIEREYLEEKKKNGKDLELMEDRHVEEEKH